MDTTMYPNTTWNPHERKRRLSECDYENDSISTHTRTYKVYGEATTAFISKGGFTFRDGSTSMANETKHERGKTL